MNKKTEGIEIEIGGVKVETPQQVLSRISLLLWGSSGSGKTTLAATAPGKKLWINFDPDGTNAITNRDDIEVVDFSGQPDNCVMKFRKENPIGLNEYLQEHPEIETVVVDSLTMFGEAALQHGVVEARSTPKGAGATIEDPGYSGYGNKNTWTRLLVKNILQVTKKNGRHAIFIAHEDKPVTDKEGIVLFISIMLGSSLIEQVPIRLSEIWNLTDTGEERRIAVRNCRWRKPMKSRMFITSGEPEFVWNFDADKLEGEGIAEWFDAWKKNKGRKIPLPQ